MVNKFTKSVIENLQQIHFVNLSVDADNSALPGKGIIKIEVFDIR